MSKREIVILVSRALAIIQIVTVLLEITSLPQALLGLFHHLLPLQTPVFGDYSSRYYMEAVLVGDGRIGFRSTLISSVASLFTIASGGSIGREGPMVQLAAMLGSKLGTLAGAPVPRLRLLAAAGALA